MRLSMVGLGRMGAGMSRRLLRAGHELCVHDLDAARVSELVAEGATGAADLEELVRRTERPRNLWLMLPAGSVTETALAELAGRLEPGDLVVDGGNSFFADDVRRARELAELGIAYVDVGVSGGVFGLERGYCLMAGGTEEAVARLEPVLESLAPGDAGVEPVAGRAPGTEAQGWLHCGGPGAGHYVKMVHNGIEYGLMQAYAEGLELLHSPPGAAVPEEERYALDLAAIAELWRRGSVVGSWLLDLTAAALAEDPALEAYGSAVGDSGEGRWSVATAVRHGVPAPVITAALYARFSSRGNGTFGGKALSAMRARFGGHAH